MSYRVVFLVIALMIGYTPYSFSQKMKGFIKGRTLEASSNEAISLTSVFITETSEGAETDSSGYFIIGPLAPGQYTLNASHLGYKDVLMQTVAVSAGDTSYIELAMDFESNTLDEIMVKATPFKKGVDVPPNLHSMFSSEIQRNPGSDNDISKVIRTLPGVTTLSSFRNDLIIRGGAPNENRFFLDGIEIPVINHLVTQGASGGAFSIINSRQLREVDYMSSSFPANRGNALSSVFDFYLKDGARDGFSGSMWLGGTEAGISLESPVGKNTSMLLSARRSYRQYILKMLNFAFLPVYNDMTAKVKINLNKKSTLTFLGIGAIDDFSLNEEVGNNEVQNYLLENLPVSDQSNYTVGAVYNYYGKNSNLTIVGSRSGLINSAEKYYNNDFSNPDYRILDYSSGEYSNRARIEYSYTKDYFKFTAGAGLEDLSGNYDVYNRIYNNSGPIIVDYNSDLRFQQYSLFSQIAKSWWNDRLILSMTGRVDGNNYNQNMKDPFDHISGRVNLAVGITHNTTLNLGVGNYYQLPPMMTLSYRNSGELDNQELAQYLQSKHYTAGFSWNTNISSKLSVEGFLKKYPGYMFSLRDNISLAHQPVDFGVFGNFPVDFRSEGRAYGVEVFYQQRLFKGFYGMLTYTLSKSEYLDQEGNFKPSTWDANHIVNFTLGKKINEKWEVGVNWRMQSALPYTPFDMELSSLRSAWDINNQGIRDYAQLNTQRGKSTNIINARVDRIYKFPKWTLNLFLDLENITSDTDSQQALILDRQKDEDGNLTNDGIIINPDAPYEEQRYRLKFISNAQGAFIPTFGFIIKY